MLQGNVFEADLQVQPGSSTVTVQATDVNGNVATKQYQVTVAGSGATYSYDANGNLQTKVEGSDTWTYEWNAENQLTRVLSNGVEVVRSGYDALGRRVERVSGGTTTTWTHDAEDILRQAVGSATVKFLHGPGIDEPLAEEGTTGSLAFLNADAIGSIIRSTDGAGAVTSSRRYSAFGDPELGAAVGYAFTGREWDTAVGFAYYRARYYDASQGRFMSEDPIRWWGGVNLYRYVGNSPVTYLDPAGLTPLKLPISNPTTAGICVLLFEYKLHSQFLFNEADEVFPDDLQKRRTYDRERHCYVTCESVRWHAGLPAPALAASYGKELIDLVHGGDWDDSMEDLRSDMKGITSGWNPSGGSCRLQCAGSGRPEP
jgi:RHS repeat-associated protein